MSDTSFQPGGAKGVSPFLPQTFPGGPVPDDGTSIDPGDPVTIFDESVKSKADASATANVSGLAVSAAEYPNRPILQFAGPLTLPTERWDAITGGSGGLTPHEVYYLSAATAGKLTTTPPVSGFITPVGFAHNETTLMIQIGAAVATGG
jgi:hypothetical protein